MADEISSEAGDNVDTSATGRGNQQSRQQSNPRQNQRNDPSQNVNYYASEGSRDWIVSQITDHAQQLRDLVYRLDDIPNQFGRLVVKVDNQAEKTSDQDERVKRLEGLEVIVSNQRLVVRPIPPPEASMPRLHWLAVYAIIGFLIIIGLVSYLIWLQGGRGG